MKRTLSLILLLSAAPLAIYAQPAPTPQSSPGPGYSTKGGERTVLFQIILLRASMSGTDELNGLPKNAGKAVADIRDFLPYKSYRILDSALLRASQDAGGWTRLDGIPPQQYDVRILFKPASGERLNIWDFTVQRARASEAEAPVATPAPSGATPQPPERPVISTSFSVEIGETIVVGSSKLAGGDAMVILFTAIPKR